MILKAVYEQDFLDCSYGFRSHHSAHGTLDGIWKNLMDVGGGWVLQPSSNQSSYLLSLLDKILSMSVSFLNRAIEIKTIHS